jgi:hypothetical protein
VFDMRRIGAQIKGHLFSPEQVKTIPTETLEMTVAREERRRSPRVELEMLLTATTNSGEVFQGYCRNLSREGAAALVWGDLKIGDQVQLSYRPLGSKSEEVIVPALVRQSVGYRYGFEFSVENEIELSSLLVESCRVACLA